MVVTRPLACFFPGAFATLAKALAQTFASVHPGAQLQFHSFVPSGQLVAEILAGALADVVITANRAYMAELVAAGLVNQPAILAGNRLCLIVRPECCGQVNALGDLAHPGIRVVVPQAQTDPCGQYVARLFALSGLAHVMADKEYAGELLRSHGSADLPAFLARGEADVGILYRSEAQALGTVVQVVSLPPTLDLHEEITFMIGAVWRNGQIHPLAEALVSFCCRPAGQSLLCQAGFLPREMVMSTGER